MSINIPDHLQYQTTIVHAGRGKGGSLGHINFQRLAAQSGSSDNGTCQAAFGVAESFELGCKSTTMATFQSLCPTCRKIVTAHTMQNNEDVMDALKSKMDVRVMHVVRMADGTSADHVWSLDDDARNNLSKYFRGH